MIGIKQTLVCPTCSFENDFEEYNKNEELYFYCVNCEYLIRANIPFLLLMKEFFISIFFSASLNDEKNLKDIKVHKINDMTIAV